MVSHGVIVKSRQIITVVAAVTIVLAAGTRSDSARATPPEGEIVRTDLAKGTTQTPLAIVTQGQATTFYVQNVLLKPAASSGWHTHPGPEYSVVTTGTVYVQMANGCPATAFNEGQAIFIPGGVPHVVYNQGPDEANGVVTYTLPVDLPIREDVPDACP